jgi:hypothetical protein
LLCCHRAIRSSQIALVFAWGFPMAPVVRETSGSEPYAVRRTDTPQRLPLVSGKTELIGHHAASVTSVKTMPSSFSIRRWDEP